MYLKHLKFFVISAMIISNHANADLLSSFKLPDKPLLELLENGPSWMPKPYKITFDQGHLIEKNKIEQLRAGLTKEQIIFLLGTPSSQVACPGWVPRAICRPSAVHPFHPLCGHRASRLCVVHYAPLIMCTTRPSSCVRRTPSTCALLIVCAVHPSPRAPCTP